MQLDMKAKKTFIDFMGESNRLSNNSFKSMENSINRIQQELVIVSGANQDLHEKQEKEKADSIGSF